MQRNEKSTKRRAKVHPTLLRLYAKTHPNNWPLQEVLTLDAIISDRSLSVGQFRAEKIQASAT